MLDKIKILLGLTDDSKDELLNVLIGLCKDEAIDFCNLKEYSKKLCKNLWTMEKERRLHLSVQRNISKTLTEDLLL
jgi:hypothetical protein